MKAMELLDIIGTARDAYVAEAGKIRSGEAAAKVRPVGMSKAVLIAAMIALLLLLVGCAAYILRLQSMKVGEHEFPTHVYQDENGETYPGTTREPTTLVSLQGANLAAMEEWLEFKESYDPDGALLEANDRNEAGIPEPYNLTYWCYTWEMVEKLERIREKYGLKLLSTYVTVHSEENSLMFDALGIDGYCHGDAMAEVEYLGGYYYPEGTFNSYATVALADAQWPYKNQISLRCSLKKYFDPVVGSVGDVDSYKQWNYTCGDGTVVLLAMNEEQARIYADLEDVFFSVQMDAFGYDGENKVMMPEKVLEQIAEVLDFSVRPKPVEIGDPFSGGEDTQDALYNSGYEDYLKQRQGGVIDPENLRYSLYDLNGDGVEELLISYYGSCVDILSTKNGQTYCFVKMPEELHTPSVYLCEGNVFELADTLSGAHYFYKAEKEGASLTAKLTKAGDDLWHLETDVRRTLTLEEADAYLQSYTRIEAEWKDFSRFGESGEVAQDRDPYAEYIAEAMANSDAPESLMYALLDLNGDGVEELICRDITVQYEQKQVPYLSIHTIIDGVIAGSDINGVRYICEGNILEDHIDSEDGTVYHAYYEWTENGTLKLIDSIQYDPADGLWLRDRDGHFGEAPVVLSEAEAQAVLGSYKRIELDMKPFAEYPMT